MSQSLNDVALPVTNGQVRVLNGKYLVYRVSSDWWLGHERPANHVVTWINPKMDVLFMEKKINVCTRKNVVCRDVDRLNRCPLFDPSVYTRLGQRKPNKELRNVWTSNLTQRRVRGRKFDVGMAEGILDSVRKFQEATDDIHQMTPQVEEVLRNVTKASSSITAISDAVVEFLNRNSATSWVSTALQIVCLVIDFMSMVTKRIVSMVPTFVLRMLDVLGVSTSCVGYVTKWVMSLFYSSQVRENSQEDEAGPSDEQFYEAEAEGLETASIGALLTGVVGMIVTGALPNEKVARRISDSLRLGVLLVPVVDNVSKLLLSLVEYLPQIFQEWIKELCPAEWWFGAFAENAPFYEFVRESYLLNTEEVKQKCAYDPAMQRKVAQLYRDGAALLVNAVEIKSVNAKCMSILNKAFTVVDELYKIVDVNTGTRGVRFTPYCICLTGRAGVGKSFIMNVIARRLAPSEINPANVVYPRNAAMAHWDGYTGQFCTIVDDFAQTRGMMQPDEYSELINMVGPVPYRLPMADLKDKGACFCSKLVLLSTNTAYPRPNTITCHEALWRRRDVLVEVEVLEEFRNANGRVDVLRAPADMSHMRFRYRNPEKPQEAPQEWIGWDQFLIDMERNFHEHNQRQQASFTRLRDQQVRMMHDEVFDDANAEGVPNVIGDRYCGWMDFFKFKKKYDLLDNGGFEGLHEDADYHMPHGYYANQDSENDEHVDEIEEGDEDEVSIFQEICTIYNNRPYGGVLSQDEFREEVQRVLDVLWLKGYNYPDGNEVDFRDVILTWIQTAYFLNFGVAFSIGMCETLLNEMRLFPLGQAEGLLAAFHEKVTCLGSCIDDNLEKFRLDMLELDKYFSEYRDAWMNEHPRIKMFYENYKMWIGAIGAFALAFSFVYLTSPDDDGQGKVFAEAAFPSGDQTTRRISRKVVRAESGFPSGDETTRRVPKKVVVAENSFPSGDMQTRRVKQHRVQAEGSEDVQCDTIIEKRVIPYLLRVSTIEGRAMMAFAIEGKVIMVPAHFLRGMNGEALEENTLVYFDHQGTKGTFPLKWAWVYQIPGKDFCLVYCGPRMRSFRSNVGHFIHEDDLSHNTRFPGALVSIKGSPLVQYTEVQGIDRADYALRNLDGEIKTLYTVRNGWTHKASTGPGFCGAVLLSRSHATQHKIVGMHVGSYTAKQQGLAELITFEMLQKGLKALPFSPIGMPVPCELIDDVDKCSVVPEGEYMSILGRVPPKLAMRQPVKSDIIPSVIHDVVFEHATEPAALHKSDPRLIVVGSPLLRGISKYGTPQPQCLDTNCIKRITTDLTSRLRTLPRNEGLRRVLTENESINGIPGAEHMDSMNMQTSPGWPYRALKRNVKGKEYLFRGEIGERVVDDVELRRRLDFRRECLERGVRCPSAWTDCVKDERRPLDKVAAGKTRVFTIAPVDFTIETRRYFLSFVAMLESNYITGSDSAIGVNPESPDWTMLMTRLLENSNLGFAGDFGRYDSSLHPEVIYALNDIISGWYDDGEQNRRIREVLLDEMIHTVVIGNNCCYAKHRGNPSGCPITSTLNTLCNMIYMRYVFLKLAPCNYSSLVHYDKNVCSIMYGDDNILSVKPEVLEWFNMMTVQQAFQELGMEYTTADKAMVDVPYYDVTTLSFLKRAFRKSGAYWVPLMDVITIQESTNWIRNCDDESQACIDNVNDGLRWAFFYGRSYFESFRKCVVRALEECNIFPCVYDYEYFVSFYYDVGMVMPHEKCDVIKCICRKC